MAARNHFLQSFLAYPITISNLQPNLQAVPDCLPGRNQVRRLRIQQRLKTGGAFEEDVSKREYSSAVPLLPPLVPPPPAAPRAPAFAPWPSPSSL